MVYSDKKKSYFAIKVDNTINLNNGLLKNEEKLGKLILTNDDININGEITISIFETMTKEKLLEKSIVINDKIGNVYQVVFSAWSQTHLPL